MRKEPAGKNKKEKARVRIPSRAPPVCSGMASVEFGTRLCCKGVREREREREREGERERELERERD